MIINKLLLMVICSFHLYSEVIINEVMPAPLGSEPEWIELYNPDDEIYINDSLWVYDLLKGTLFSLVINPGEYVILTPNPQELINSRYIPNETNILQVNFPVLNNTFDAVVLKDLDGNILDSLFYDLKNGNKGFSFERVSYNLPAYSDNLKISIAQDSATPGRINSVTPKNNSVLISEVKLRNRQICISINNISAELTKFDLKCYINNDLLFSNNNILLDANSSVDYYSEPLNYFGNNQIKVLISTLNETPEYDTLIRTVNFPPERDIIKINEIMSYTDNYSVPYIELYNSSKSSIDLKNYRLYDKAELGKNGAEIIESFIINANDYAVLAWDSLIFDYFPYLKDMANVYILSKKITYNKTGDIVLFESPDGAVMDSMYYYDSWHNSSLISFKNISIEKISPVLYSDNKSNWASCVDESGGTPGIENSVHLNSDLEKNIDISPNPFSPFESRAVNECFINYNYEFRDASVTARIYDRNGAMLRELKNNESSAGSGLLKWDGRNDEGFILQPAPYILIFQIKNNENDKIYHEKQVIVVGK